MGKIEVQFYEVVDSGVQPDMNDDDAYEIVPNLTAAVATAANPKALSTGKGSKLGVVEYNDSTLVRGELIDTVTIHYCTATELLHIGVLSPWEWLQAKAPLTKRQKIDPKLAAIQPKILHVQTVIEDGVLLVQGGRKELFDLSELPSDNEDDGDDGGDEEERDNEERNADDEFVHDNGRCNDGGRLIVSRKRCNSAAAAVSQSPYETSKYGSLIPDSIVEVEKRSWGILGNRIEHLFVSAL